MIDSPAFRKEKSDSDDAVELMEELMRGQAGCYEEKIDA